MRRGAPHLSDNHFCSQHGHMKSASGMRMYHIQSEPLVVNACMQALLVYISAVHMSLSVDHDMSV
jgi:hypothetical protein